MAQPLKSIKLRIRSIENTKKLTHAMEMISVSKLKRAEHALEAARPYFLRIESLLMNVLSADMKAGHPFLKPGTGKGNIALLLVTSDTGLCSSYNHAVIQMAEKFLSKYAQDKARVITLGKKGFSHFKKKGFSLPYSYIGLNGRYSGKVLDKVIQDVESLFLSQEVDQVYIAYTNIESSSRSTPVLEKLFNIEPLKGSSIDYVFEPGIGRILEELIPLYVFCKIKMAFLNAFTSEHKARTIAMGEATKNARELLEGLILLRNKIRQSNITREIIEVISSAEALKG